MMKCWWVHHESEALGVCSEFQLYESMKTDLIEPITEKQFVLLMVDGYVYDPVIFVFGSNLAGRHGKGAALDAMKVYDAEYGVGQGRTGSAYAIPTKDKNLRTRTLRDIKLSVLTFMLYAKRNPELTFEVTKIGCGLAGCKEQDIGPMFSTVPTNCILPHDWDRFRKG